MSEFHFQSIDIMSPDTNQTSKQPAAGSGEPVRRPFEIISSHFMKRTLLMVVVSLVLVAAMLVRINLAWPGYYLFGGVWALVFFILTPLILRDLIGHQRIFRGLGLIILKIGWLVLVAVMMFYWMDITTLEMRPVGLLLVAGIGTPLVVASLRLAGLALAQGRKGCDAGEKNTSGTKPDHPLGLLRLG